LTHELLTGWFKSAGAAPGLIYFGYAPLDKKKQGIGSYHVLCAAGTETTLAEPCKKEDTVIKVTTGSKWKTGIHYCVAFEADDSGQFTDLPNRKVTGLGVTRVENQGDCWAVHLKRKCGRSCPAGTKVREQQASNTFLYNAASRKPAGMEWTQFTGRIKGVAKTGIPVNQWWPGTKYAQILILANFNQGKEFELMVDDVTLTAVEE